MPHIGEKILNEIQKALEREYNIEEIDWVLFKQPLDTSNAGAFIERQEKSKEIIEKILVYHGKNQILEYLKQLASIEQNIQNLQPWVRDHVVHAINTFLVGVYILHKVYSFKLAIGNKHAFMWKLCGPTHDLGYPLEIANNVKKPFLDKINESLNELGSLSPRIKEQTFPENLNILCRGINANELIQKRLDEWRLDINIDHYYQWLNDNNNIDHGTISALAQLKIVDALYQKNNPDRKEIENTTASLNWKQSIFLFDIVSASAALFIHNINLEYDGFTQKIDFNSAPLAFLLFLCDTFQEWDRYTKTTEKFFPGDKDFDIDCSRDLISLSVPEKLKEKIIQALNQRLKGFKITVNNAIVVE